jgi:hypothetical protein
MDGAARHRRRSGGVFPGLLRVVVIIVRKTAAETATEQYRQRQVTSKFEHGQYSFHEVVGPIDTVTNGWFDPGRSGNGQQKPDVPWTSLKI